MNLVVVTSLVVVLIISSPSVEASRRCWCDARVNGVVIKDFGVIARCSGWCGCRNNAINRCGLTCDEKVSAWAKSNCLQAYKGQQVRSHFKASSCKTGDGTRTYKCVPKKYCYKKITKRVPYTCYRTVTQTVSYVCGNPIRPNWSSGLSGNTPIVKLGNLTGNPIRPKWSSGSSGNNPILKPADLLIPE